MLWAFGRNRGHLGFASKVFLCITVKTDDVRSGAREGAKGNRSEWSIVKSSFHARMSSAVVTDFFIL